MSNHKSSVSSAIASIQSKLAAANGKRKVRTVNYSEAVQAIREALRDGYGYVNGGTVANNYGYPAIQTIVTAIAGERVVIFDAFVAKANKGHGTGLPWTRAASAEKIRKTILDLAQCPAPKGFALMTRRTAIAIVSERDHADAIRALESIPSELLDSTTPVTASDSLACGNCASETARVQSWFPERESVPANELLQKIVETAPSLVSFAIRAIQYAQRRIIAA
jgi:hypothetical protein